MPLTRPRSVASSPSHSSRRWTVFGWAALWLVPVVAGAASCGARTGLEIPPPAPEEPECVADEDCPGYGDMCNPVTCHVEADAGASDAGVTRLVPGVCRPLTPVDCDDHDPCTNDACDPGSGKCSYALASFDNDHDGYRGPRAGTQVGDPDACGDDCDDTSAAAHPGGIEVCDGVDNDCNGVVDDGATFAPQFNAVQVSTPGIAPAGPGGLAFSGSSYAAIYTGTDQGFDMFLSLLDETTGQVITPPGEQSVTAKNADGAGGPIVWIGDRYGLAWQDRRDADYEVYFTLLKENGDKAIPDQRLTFAGGFSINVALTWNGTEFIAVWQDERNGTFDLFGQRISMEGAPIGDNVPLTQNGGGFGSESPSVSAGVETVGIAWTAGDAYTHFIQFQTHAFDLTGPVSAPISVTDGSTEAVYPTVVWNQDRYIVAWFDKSASPKGVWAAAYDEAGNVLVAPRPISQPGAFRSRYPFMKALGDRVLFIYSDDRDQNGGYELYSVMMATDLTTYLSAEQRLTQSPQDSVYPIATFGPQGTVGVLYRDDLSGAHHVYFTSLACLTTGPSGP